VSVCLRKLPFFSVNTPMKCFETWTS